MNQRERFHAIMDYREFDRLPVWYFGQWEETLARWQKEGLASGSDIPRTTGMDPDWENGLWDIHGLARIGAISGRERRVLEETNDHRLVKTALGAVIRESKQGSSIPQHIEEALKPTRAAWRAFRQYLDPRDPARTVADWESQAEQLNRRDTVAAFLGGSLFGWPRDWMGVEAISYLVYDDPALYEEIIDCVAEHFMTILRPVLAKTKFDLAYFFEDCCFNTGPLFSPDVYRHFYHKYYRKMVDFYHDMGVKHVMLDSDGKVDDLIPCWLESGFDIVFPIEVGTWKASPVDLRRRFGRSLRMIGGVDKHVIPRGSRVVTEHLRGLSSVAMEGGYIPLPDHRIPPDCSLEQFREYVRVFKAVMANG